MAEFAIISAYEEFMLTAHNFVNIECESDYQGALEVLENLLESANDVPNDALNPLIDMLSKAIENYEFQDHSLYHFVEECENEKTDISLLKMLMINHNLTGSHFPEIGDKTMVSKVLNGKRTLTRSAIERLAHRFGLRPSMFYEEF